MTISIIPQMTEPRLRWNKITSVESGQEFALRISCSGICCTGCSGGGKGNFFFLAKTAETLIRKLFFHPFPRSGH